MKVSKLTMAALVRKKQDDKNLKILREIVLMGGNRQCFDCEQKGPTYVNMTIGSFVCAKCAGSLRGLTPPHRVKSISMATFTSDEIDYIKLRGNDECAKTWLGLYDPRRATKQDQREFMIDKYEQKRYYLEPASPLKSLTGNNKFSQDAQQNFNCTIPKPVSSRTPSAPITSTYNSPNNFPTKFPSESNAITKIQAPIAKTNGQINGANRTNVSPRNLNNNVTSATDTDFVADFSTAVIFNGATYNNNSSSKSTKTDNLYSTTAQNGTNLNENDNFADFEHNPIFNAAFPTSWVFTNNNSNNGGKMGSATVYSTTDRYAALKDLDEQLREDKSVFQSQSTQSVQEQHQQNPFKLQNGNLHSLSNPFQVLGDTKMNYSGAIDNERYNGSNDFSQMHQRNPFQIPNAKSNNPFL
ncbi:Arf-GAP domain and FG repeat-containing protein 1 [Pseudolycoriella hygida]|uniref:Arf-GAP domain and FG repeat-containing protein 1 n=1 Tax=Pseudolycoriella hygida TaxID=35572 RepID=A0A9Q0N8U2_9DIPT|nr:Arf-GAP domain and FG repeat-containing protein 1 [Pseudolycoriella hygida]